MKLESPYSVKVEELRQKIVEKGYPLPEHFMIDAARKGNKEELEQAKEYYNVLLSEAGSKGLTEGNKVVKHVIHVYNLTMHEAAKVGHESIVLDMLSMGANAYNATLCAAARFGSLSIVKAMIQKGAVDILRAIEFAESAGKQTIVDYLNSMKN